MNLTRGWEIVSLATTDDRRIDCYFDEYGWGAVAAYKFYID